MTQTYKVQVSMNQAHIVESGFVWKQGDFGFNIEIEVLDFDTTGATPQIIFRKSTGAVEATQISVAGNKFTYAIRGTELDTPGPCVCDLKLNDSTTKRVSTASFKYFVIPDTMDGLNQHANSYSDTIAQIWQTLQDYSEDSEAWAKGTKAGTPVPSSAAQYHNNSKYYADLCSYEVGEIGKAIAAMGYPLEDGYILYSNGTEQTDYSYKRTKAIEVTEGEKIIILDTFAGSSAAKIAMYNNGTYLQELSTQGDAKIYPTTVTIPSGVTHIRVCGNKNRGQIVVFSDKKSEAIWNDILNIAINDPLPANTYGWIQYSDGTINAVSGAYYSTALIPVSENDKFYVFSVFGSSSVAVMAMYNNGTYVQSASRQGTSGIDMFEVTIPSGVTHIRFCSNTNRTAVIAAKAKNNELFYKVLKNTYDIVNSNEKIYDIENLRLSDKIPANDRGYIQYSDGTVNTSSPGEYYITALIPVSENDKFYVYSVFGSSSVAVMAMYNNGTYVKSESRQGTSAFDKFEVTIPSGVTHIRFCSNTNYTAVIVTKAENNELFYKLTKFGQIENLQLTDPLPAKNWGYIQYSDGTFNTTSPGNYYATDLIPVSRNDKFYVFSIFGGSTVATMAMYNNGTYVQSASRQGASETEMFEVTIPTGVTHIRFCSNKTQTAVIATRAENNELYYKIALYGQDAQNITNIKNLTITDMLLQNTYGYVQYSDGALNTSGGAYYSTDLIPVSENDKFYVFSAFGSASVAVMAMYNNGTYVQSASRRGTSETDMFEVTIPSGVTHIRFCSNNNRTVLVATKAEDNELYYKVLKVNKDNQDQQKEIDKTKTDIKLIYPMLMTKRRAAISFTFDDGNPNDTILKGIFDDNGLKCGFAVPISQWNSRYKDYHDEGFEILAHSMDGVTGKTEQQLREMLQGERDALIEKVGECRGWVTPMSTMPDPYKPLVYDYYEYGYTIYKGNVTTPSEAGMTTAQKTYMLWRTSTDSVNETDLKAIIDYVYANNQLLSVYGHGSRLDNPEESYLTEEYLDNVLKYCKQIGIEVLTPYESNLKYFYPRHNEDFTT